ncbi:2-oxo-4-hydroxy-4-carboxy-5-ureidoimidazoline decarboxylase [Gracilibacillus caseinilyticus]|uniref:2-oxo-4-hydroxy-4-carboxy-5-ureidoimidazoline decarboxylase n=1 Tax=Gracilibacillus caseinilyticus TaxID=2932256 RepID=A0ABY4F228_9BACI|nr:2-oxo-4-hydroxy-4-carboxy-5-ureidoimidazoline decarboxylase [Gracilibacillus caseinilyticus]UOQ49919.1 2-oxo-4-hydroxy-4-carboxy-5-ureidoimidazoline decarboxylase [Gracilibacillus caseinilyticus]
MNLEELNAMDNDSFVEALGSIFEHSPWIAKKAVDARPYHSVHDLHQRMVDVVRESTKEEKLELIRSHPDLGDRIKMSMDSVNEQKGAGLDQLDEQEFKKFQALNFQYKTKFAFPFIVSVRGKTTDEIYHIMCDRIALEPSLEFDRALSEIYQIARLRLEEKIV